MQYDNQSSHARGGDMFQNARSHGSSEPSPTEHLRPPSPTSPPSPPLTNSFAAVGASNLESPSRSDHAPGTANSFEDRLAAVDARDRGGFNVVMRDALGDSPFRGSPPRQKKPSDVWNFFGIQVPDCGTSACTQAGLPNNIDNDAFVEHRHPAASPMTPNRPHSKPRVSV